LKLRRGREDPGEGESPAAKIDTRSLKTCFRPLNRPCPPVADK